MAKTLTDQAMEARACAYAPYSGFQVGAALVCQDGTVFTTLCAERVAVGKAISSGNRAFRILAIVGGATEEEALQKPCYPCGACLQVLAEFCEPDFPILLQDGVHPLKELLPMQFCL